MNVLRGPSSPSSVTMKLNVWGLRVLGLDRNVSVYVLFDCVIIGEAK